MKRRYSSIIASLFLLISTLSVSAADYYAANVGYQVGVSGTWQDFAYGGALAGSEGKDSITSLELHLVDAPYGASIEYRVYTSSGWNVWTSDFKDAGNGSAILGLQVRLADYPNTSVYYQSYRKGLGWGIWVSNGKTSGKLDAAHPITGVRVQVAEVGVQYQSQMNGSLQSVRHNGETLGTGKLETVQMSLISLPSNAKISYRAYLKNEGWTAWASNNAVLGSNGKTIEALEAKLEGMNEYHVAIQPYVEGSGWWDWAYDGATAGSVGSTLSAYRVKIEKKVYVAPVVTVVTENAEPEATSPLTLDTDNDGFDDPFGTASGNSWSNRQLVDGYRVTGLTDVTFFVAMSIHVPSSVTHNGVDDAVNSNEFEVYLGTYVNNIFTIRGGDYDHHAYSTDNTNADYASHTMILYEDEDTYVDVYPNGDPEKLNGIVLIGVYEESEYNLKGYWAMATSSGIHRYITWVDTQDQ